MVLCVFNMLPLPPLDGGRVAVGMLPDSLALPLARLEPYGMLILLLLFCSSFPTSAERVGIQYPGMADRRAGRGADPLRADDHRSGLMTSRDRLEPARRQPELLLDLDGYRGADRSAAGARARAEGRSRQDLDPGARRAIPRFHHATTGCASKSPPTIWSWRLGWRI